MLNAPEDQPASAPAAEGAIDEESVLSFRGYVHSAQDAMILFEAAARGHLTLVSERLQVHQRAAIGSGSVYIYNETTSTIKRWTDGLCWSPSRILGVFLIYRETDRSQSGHRLKGSAGLKPNGLVKKTISVECPVSGHTFHCVCYSSETDAPVAPFPAPIEQLAATLGLIPRPFTVKSGKKTASSSHSSTAPEFELAARQRSQSWPVALPFLPRTGGSSSSSRSFFLLNNPQLFPTAAAASSSTMDPASTMSNTNFFTDLDRSSSYLYGLDLAGHPAYPHGLDLEVASDPTAFDSLGEESFFCQMNGTMDPMEAMGGYLYQGESEMTAEEEGDEKVELLLHEGQDEAPDNERTTTNLEELFESRQGPGDLHPGFGYGADGTPQTLEEFLLHEFPLESEDVRLLQIQEREFSPEEEFLQLKGELVEVEREL